MSLCGNQVWGAGRMVRERTFQVLVITGYNWGIITALLFPPPCFPSRTTLCPECLSFSVVAHPNPINVWLKGHLLQQASLFSLGWQELSLV